MPNKCCVPGCKGNIRGRHKVHLYSFPKDEHLCKKWVAAIAQKDFIPSKHSRVCVRHFANKDIIRTLKTTNAMTKKIINVSLKIPKLKPGSIPTISPSGDKRIMRMKKVNIETLICLMKNREPIWDVKNQEYNNRYVNKKMWAEVADELGLSVQNAKLKWRNLRYRYRAMFNNTLKRSENKKWKWYDSLSFLREVINATNVDRKCWDGDIVQITEEILKNLEDSNNDSTNDSVDLDEMTPDITGLPAIYHKGQTQKFTDISDGASEEEKQFECYLIRDISTPSANCTIPEETSPVVDTVESTDIILNNTQYCYDSTNNPDHLDEEKPDITNLPPLDNTKQTFSDESEGIGVKEESDKCDTYWFLMSTRKAMKSLPLNRQIYLRCKIQHLIRDELEKINCST